MGGDLGLSCMEGRVMGMIRWVEGGGCGFLGCFLFFGFEGIFVCFIVMNIR